MERPLIMVLNADQQFLDMIAEFLGEEGYDAVTFKEDMASFDAILQRQPDLVMIELVITNPEAGLMVVNKMRLHPQTARIPIIIASTITQLLRDNEAHLRSKGCDILPKPFDLEELLTIIGKYVPPATA
jgi:DNA-binding response OmpR family regulator